VLWRYSRALFGKLNGKHPLEACSFVHSLSSTISAVKSQYGTFYHCCVETSVVHYFLVYVHNSATRTSSVAVVQHKRSHTELCFERSNVAAVQATDLGWDTSDFDVSVEECRAETWLPIGHEAVYV
jgi:hypothetical protein